MSPKSPLSLLFATILVLLISVSYIHSLPAVVKRDSQFVGYADLLGGRVTITQLASGGTVFTGQFNNGFDQSSNPNDYTITFQPSGYVLKVNYSILNGGTSAFTTTVNDARLSPGSGTNLANNNLVVSRNGKVIGSAPVVIV
ncbi:8023_t:CDS:1 [Ambispora leptoticha]|uniref:8023_t:CDS:1 n=1 Tax=Ambispora leptoticha TaxID=144679 RepID=A0A9N9G1V1_9GLOM|nr:8023_t:CDS:1 [Ambispora leptoticha]